MTGHTTETVQHTTLATLWSLIHHLFVVMCAVQYGTSVTVH